MSSRCREVHNDGPDDPVVSYELEIVPLLLVAVSEDLVAFVGVGPRGIRDAGPFIDQIDLKSARGPLRVRPSRSIFDEARSRRTEARFVAVLGPRFSLLEPVGYPLACEPPNVSLPAAERSQALG